MIIYIGQFWTDILEFRGHLDFLYTKYSYIWILCPHSIHFDININFLAQRQGDIDNIILCRQPFWVLAAILDSGWGTTCVPRFFWSYVCCQHILKMSCWYHEVIYSGTIWHIQIALIWFCRFFLIYACFDLHLCNKEKKKKIYLFWSNSNRVLVVFNWFGVGRALSQWAACLF